MPSSGGRVSPVYNCIKSSRARDKLNALAEADPRFTNIWDGVVWVVLRNPKAGAVIPGKQDTHVIITTDFLAIGMPVMEVYYTVLNENLVEFIEIHT